MRPPVLPVSRVILSSLQLLNLYQIFVFKLQVCQCKWPIINQSGYRKNGIEQRIGRSFVVLNDKVTAAE